MSIKVKYIDGKIYAGNTTSKKGHEFGAYHGEVTDACISAVLQYLVEMKTTSDSEEIVETIDPIKKYGQLPYRVEIKMTPLK